VALISVAAWVSSRSQRGFFPSRTKGRDRRRAAARRGVATAPGAVVDQINRIIQDTAGVADWVTIGGNRSGRHHGSTRNVLHVFKPWEERTHPESQPDAIVATRREASRADSRGITFVVFRRRRIRAWCRGFRCFEDRGGVGRAAPQQVSGVLHDGATQSGCRHQLPRSGRCAAALAGSPCQGETLGSALTSVFGTLQTYLGSAYVNDFNLFAAPIRCVCRQNPAFRTEAGNIAAPRGAQRAREMIPLGAVVDVRDAPVRRFVPRYNLYHRQPSPGRPRPATAPARHSRSWKTGGEQLPPALGYEWTAISLPERSGQ